MQDHNHDQYSHPADIPVTEGERTKAKTGFGVIAFSLGLFLLKFGKPALLAVKGSKFLTTSLSMITSIGAYALLFGWPFAAGFVLLLFVHEMGHVIQLRREGIGASAPIFIPFLGAAIAMKEMPKDAQMEARVGLAGPILGTAGVLFTWYMATLFTGDARNLLLALAYTGAFLNLFNLLPISPLDGGRAMAAISPKGWLLGVLGMASMLVLLGPNPILILICLIGGFETYSRFKNKDKNKEYYAVPASAKRRIVMTYLGLVIGLVYIMSQTFVQV